MCYGKSARILSRRNGSDLGSVEKSKDQSGAAGGIATLMSCSSASRFRIAAIPQDHPLVRIVQPAGEQQTFENAHPIQVGRHAIPRPISKT